MNSKIRATCGLVLSLVLLHARPSSGQDLQLTLKDGRVTIYAQNVSLRQILAEWERIGRTAFPDRERLPGTPVTLTLVNQIESDALSTLLRASPGYLAIRRTDPSAGASTYRSVIIMAGVATPPQGPSFASSQPGASSQTRSGMGRLFGNSMGPGRMRGDDPSDPNQDASDNDNQADPPMQLGVAGGALGAPPAMVRPSPDRGLRSGPFEIPQPNGQNAGSPDGSNPTNPFPMGGLGRLGVPTVGPATTPGGIGQQAFPGASTTPPKPPGR